MACTDTQEVDVLGPETCLLAAQILLDCSKMRPGSWGWGVSLRRLLLLQLSTASLVASGSSEAAGFLSCLKLLIGSCHPVLTANLACIAALQEWQA